MLFNTVADIKEHFGGFNEFEAIKCRDVMVPEPGRGYTPWKVNVQNMERFLNG